MVSDPEFGNSLTVDNASSADYTLTVMTVVAAVLVPIILLYQAWTYHVFRGPARRGRRGQPGRSARPEDRKLGRRWGRSTRAWSTAPGRCASCSRSTPSSASSPRCSSSPRRCCSRGSLPVASKGRRSGSSWPRSSSSSSSPHAAAPPPGDSRSRAGGQLRARSPTFGWTWSSAGSATARPRSTARRARRWRPSPSVASTRSRPRSPAISRSSCWRWSSRSPCSPSWPGSTFSPPGSCCSRSPLCPCSCG